jgi:organic radical activating enzyme
MMMLTSEFVYGCNLRCEFCVTFSPYLKGYIPADELLKSYSEWRKKVKPKYFVLSGGEPLLHPELTRILRESAKIWNDSKLWITTNGLLLDRVNPEVLQAIKETGFELIVTEHTFEPEHRKTLDAVYKRLKKDGVRFCVRESRSMWLAVYQYGEKDSLIPYTSNPKKAWECCVYRQVVIILDDKMYKCSPLLHAHYGIQKGIMNADDWKLALTYQPLTLQSTPEEIVKHLRESEIPECVICFEKPVTVPSKQLPLAK